MSEYESMKLIKNIFVLFYTLRGGMSYRYDKFHSAVKYLEKAIKYNSTLENEMLFQYYGHSLFRLNDVEKAFQYLKKSYEIYENKNWLVSNEEEYRLAKETLKVLDYIITNYDKKLEGFHVKKHGKFMLDFNLLM